MSRQECAWSGDENCNDDDARKLCSEADARDEKQGQSEHIRRENNIFINSNQFLKSNYTPVSNTVVAVADMAEVGWKGIEKSHWHGGATAIFHSGSAF